MSEDMNQEVTETNEVATEAKKQDALLPLFLQWKEEGMEDDDIIMKLHEEHDLTLSSAVARFRKLKSEAGLTAHKGHKSEEVREFIKQEADAGKSRAEIIEAMVDKFGYTKKSAASTYSTQAKKLGLIGEGVGVSAKLPMEEVVRFMRANADLKKQEFVAKMSEELGYAPSTCGAFYTYMPMAKEWAKQELGQ